MSRDQFDDLVTGHLRATAPREAPARVFDATLDRISSTPQRGAGWRLGRVGGLLATAAVVVLAVVAGTQLGGLIDGPVGNDPSASPSVTPTVTGAPSPSASPISTPPPPVPTEPATSSDALLLRIVSLGGPIDPFSMLPGVTVTADGTVIWRPVSTTELAGYLTRRLTDDGLAELRQIVFGDGLLDADATHELEPLPDVEPPGRGAIEHTFTVGEGDDQVVVTSVGWLGDEEEATYYEPDPERQALDGLASQLRDPEALLGEDAWEGPATEYEADEYLLVLTAYRDVPPYGNPDISQVPVPTDDAPDEFGDPYGGSVEPPNTRCGVLNRDEAAAIVDALTTLGVSEENSVGMDRATGASLDWAEGNGVVDLYLLPRMPGDYPGCDGRP
jgi:hypothetical protein